MASLSTIFFVLAAANFGFAGYYYYTSTKRADRISKKKINEISEGAKQQSGSIFRVRTDNIDLNQYDFSQVIKTINSYIDHFNEINKNINKATEVVSIISGLALIMSGIILVLI